MTREEFERRFREVLRQAAADAAAAIGHRVVLPDRFEVLGPPDLHGRRVTSDEAVDALYLRPDRSRVFIDVGVKIGGDLAGDGWVRPSSHQPRPPNEVWDADGLGPFKSVGGVGTTAMWESARKKGLKHAEG